MTLYWRFVFGLLVASGVWILTGWLYPVRAMEYVDLSNKVVCVNGTQYYKYKEATTFFLGKSYRGYGFMSPVVIKGKFQECSYSHVTKRCDGTPENIRKYGKKVYDKSGCRWEKVTR